MLINIFLILIKFEERRPLENDLDVATILIEKT